MFSKTKSFDHILYSPIYRDLTLTETRRNPLECRRCGQGHWELLFILHWLPAAIRAGLAPYLPASFRAHLSLTFSRSVGAGVVCIKLEVPGSGRIQGGAIILMKEGCISPITIRTWQEAQRAPTETQSSRDPRRKPTAASLRSPRQPGMAQRRRSQQFYLEPVRKLPALAAFILRYLFVLSAQGLYGLMEKLLVFCNNAIKVSSATLIK